MNELLWAVRDSVEAAASDFEIEPAPLLTIDVHTASSLLQKSIRRADSRLALSAAKALLLNEPARFWRRFATCLFEDIGPHDRDLILSALSIAPRKGFPSAKWREVASILSRAANASKSQVANHHLHLAVHDPAEFEAVSKIDCLSFDDAFECLDDERLTSIQRVLIAWRLSGVECGRAFQPEPHFEADHERLFERLDKCLDSVCLSVILREGVRLTRSALPLSAVLQADSYESSNHVAITSDEMPESGVVKGLPGYVFDQHTRIGKRALAKALNECTRIQKVVSSVVGHKDRLKCLSSAHFEYEAALLTKRLQHPPELKLLQRVHFIGAHRQEPFASEIYDALAHDWECFTTIRSQLSA
ncbi:hypothetical protein ACFFUB_08035 [Algimonas porphyrae]|uniref:hypothetical protein n=1 Tax=Algimonas porphyrae TaxID=1128113 RepID=UPI0024E0F407|nr:hypothetical protein [Algimonas porphyrae]